MPKNKGKGGKNRRRGKNDNDGEKKELQFKEDGQEYGQVLRMLGQGRLEAHCFDGVKRLCHIRGKMRKRVWVNSGDIVLVSLRDYQDRKGDIIAKYTPDEARCLKNYGELPSNAKVNDNDMYEEVDDVGIEFQEESEGESVENSDEDAKNKKSYGNTAKNAAVDEEDEEEEEEEEYDYVHYNRENKAKKDLVIENI